MLDDKAMVMLLLNEAKREGKMGRALEILGAHTNGQNVPDWQRARISLQALVSTAAPATAGDPRAS